MVTKDISRPKAPISALEQNTNLRKDALGIALISILVLLSWIPRARGPIDLRWDAGVYFVLGTSLAEGRGYRLLNEPGSIQAIQYPPGLAAIVALHEALLRSSDPLLVGLWLRRSFLVLSLLYAIGAFLFGTLFIPRRYALLLSAACVLNYQMYFLETLCFAEIPFAVCSVLFGYFYFKPNTGSVGRVLTPLAAIATYLMRTIGIALLIAWIADAAMRKQFRQAALRAAIALVPVLFWQTYIHSVESSDNYRHPYYAYQRDLSLFYNVSYSTNVALKSPFQPEQGVATRSDMLLRIVRNAVTMPSYLAEAITAKEGFWIGHLTRINRLMRVIKLPEWSFRLVVVPLGLMVIGGIMWHLWRREWLTPIYLSLTVGAICTTTWSGQFPRYLAPAEPFLLVVFLSFLLHVGTVLRRHFERLRTMISVLIVSIALFVLCESAVSCLVGYRNFRDGAVYYDVKGIRREYTLFHYSGADSPSEKGLEWLAARANPNAVIAVSMPQWVYLKTGLKTVMPPLEANPLKAQQQIDTVPASYVALDNLLMEDDFNRRFPALVRNSPDKWLLVYASPHGEFDIYERVGLKPRRKEERPVRPLRF